ncbi:unnamed protein product, partial [Nesidiocoris tenuis]
MAREQIRITIVRSARTSLRSAWRNVSPIITRKSPTARIRWRNPAMAAPARMTILPRALKKRVIRPRDRRRRNRKLNSLLPRRVPMRRNRPTGKPSDDRRQEDVVLVFKTI